MTVALLALLLLQQGDNVTPPAEKINEAIQRGTAALFALAEVDAGHDMFRCDELILYALIHAGMGEDPRTRKLVDRVLKQDLDKGGYPTYSVSVRAMALAQLHPRKYQVQIAQCAWWLVNTQTDNGQWDYWGLGEKPPASFPKGAWPGKVATGEASKGESALLVKRTAKWADRPPKNFGSILRNTSTAQYAILGLYAAYRAKVWIPPEIWDRALKAALTGQNKNGAWGYVHPEDKGSAWKNKGYNGPMTASQLSVLAVLHDVLETPPAELRPAVDRGFEFLSGKLNMQRAGALKGPVTMEGHDTTGVYFYYWLYSVERAGILWGRESLGGTRWYAQGANELLRLQNPDGSWGADFKGATERPANTAFAILFLKRAVPPPVITGGKQDK